MVPYDEELLIFNIYIFLIVCLKCISGFTTKTSHKNNLVSIFVISFSKLKKTEWKEKQFFRCKPFYMIIMSIFFVRILHVCIPYRKPGVYDISTEPSGLSRYLS